MSINHKGLSIGTSIVLSTIILVVGGLIYLSGREQSGSSGSAAAADDMAGHHVAVTGPTTELQNLVGKPAPNFSLQDRTGKTYALNELKGKNVVLFFNEGLMCYPSCWNQIVALSNDAKLKGDDTVALSIIVDAPAEWQRAVNKMPELGSATVVFDSDAAVSSAYGMLTTTSSMHYGQYPGHSYVVIDKEGVIRHVYDDPNMGIHNDELVEEIAKLS